MAWGMGGRLLEDQSITCRFTESSLTIGADERMFPSGRPSWQEISSGARASGLEWQESGLQMTEESWRSSIQLPDLDALLSCQSPV